MRPYLGVTALVAATAYEIKLACEKAEKNLAKLKGELNEGNRIADTLGGKSVQMRRVEVV